MHGGIIEELCYQFGHCLCDVSMFCCNDVLSHHNGETDHTCIIEEGPQDLMYCVDFWEGYREGFFCLMFHLKSRGYIVGGVTMMGGVL